MANMYGFTGKLSGKMGSAVFRVRNGQQVVAQYNPVVKNPNTEKQQSSRAAFKLMTQLASIMAPGFGTLGVTKRPAKGSPSQRNAFFEINYPLVEVAESTDGVVAKIPMEQIKLTSSFRSIPPVLVETAGDSLSVSMTSIPVDVKAVRVVLIDYRGGDNSAATQARITTIVDINVVNGSMDYTWDEIDNGKYTVLAYGLIPTASAISGVNLDNIHTPADEDFISAVRLQELVAAGDMTVTETTGGNATVAAS